MFPENPECFSVFKNINSDFYILKYLQLVGIFLEKICLRLCKFMTVLARILGVVSKHTKNCPVHLVPTTVDL